MPRHLLTFPCAGATLTATLDLPAGPPPTTGLLIVSGGNEIRAGAWGGQARLAAALAAQGHAAFRFDRRGIGDSEGTNTGFRHSAPDIAAALTAFRAAVPSLTRIAAHGNCDAATALLLASGAGADALILSNPWPHEEDTAAPTVAALRAHYRKRLLSWPALRRLLTGQIPLLSLAKSLLRLAKPAPPPAPLVAQMAQALAHFPGPARILLATNDATAQAFLSVWSPTDPRLAHCPGATHSFVEPEAQVWFERQVLEMLEK